MLIFIVIVSEFGVLLMYLGLFLWNIKYALCKDVVVGPLVRD